MQLPAFQNEKTKNNHPQLVLGTPYKSTHFEPILKRNKPEMHVLQPKWYVMVKSNFVQCFVVAFFDM